MSPWEISPPRWGVDLSPYQPSVDAPALVKAGVSFVTAKISQGTDWPPMSTGESEWAPRLLPQLAAAGVMVEGYHLIDWSSCVDEARHFVKTLGTGPCSGIWLDVENLDPLGGKWSADYLRACMVALGDLKPGVPRGVYCNWSCWSELAGHMPGVRLWLAFPEWRGGEPLPTEAVRVQCGQRFVSGVLDVFGRPTLVDVDVPATSTTDQVLNALHSATLATQPVNAPGQVSPSTDWTLTVKTLDLRGAPVTGTSVRALQALLTTYAIRALDPGLQLDGVAGPLTRSSLIRFQASHGLMPDAVAGPLTWAALVAQ